MAIVGQVGCGKTSLVSAILGEMEQLSGQVNVDVNIFLTYLELFVITEFWQTSKMQRSAQVKLQQMGSGP